MVAVKLSGPGQNRQGFIHVVYQESGSTVFDQLLHRSFIKSDNRRAAEHTLGNAQPEWLLKVNRMEQCVGLAQQFIPLDRIGIST